MKSQFFFVPSHLCDVHSFCPLLLPLLVPMGCGTEETLCIVGGFLVCSLLPSQLRKSPCRSFPCPSCPSFCCHRTAGRVFGTNLGTLVAINLSDRCHHRTTQFVVPEAIPIGVAWNDFSNVSRLKWFFKCVQCSKFCLNKIRFILFYLALKFTLFFNNIYQKYYSSNSRILKCRIPPNISRMDSLKNILVVFTSPHSHTSVHRANDLLPLLHTQAMFYLRFCLFRKICNLSYSIEENFFLSREFFNLPADFTQAFTHAHILAHIRAFPSTRHSPLPLFSRANLFFALSFCYSPKCQCAKFA